MSKESANLYNNIFSMVTLRALEYILAFILVPYLLRVLGPSNFGAVVFMQGLMGYLVLVVNYGFNLTAPRALARADEEDLTLIHISEPTRRTPISYAAFCLKKKKNS